MENASAAPGSASVPARPVLGPLDRYLSRTGEVGISGRRAEDEAVPPPCLSLL
eukprot:evm.model.scf_826.5 EVM.evm.TU.scf_826.5   scf_826:33711-33868(+)